MPQNIDHALKRAALGNCLDDLAIRVEYAACRALAVLPDIGGEPVKRFAGFDEEGGRAAEDVGNAIDQEGGVGDRRVAKNKIGQAEVVDFHPAFQRRVAQRAGPFFQQQHGGIGFFRDHAVGDIQQLRKRVRLLPGALLDRRQLLGGLLPHEHQRCDREQ